MNRTIETLARLEEAAGVLLERAPDEICAAYAGQIIDDIAEARAVFCAALGRRRADETDAAQ